MMAMALSPQFYGGGGKTEKQEDTMAWVGNKEKCDRNGQWPAQEWDRGFEKKQGEAKGKRSVKYGH